MNYMKSRLCFKSAVLLLKEPQGFRQRRSLDCFRGWQGLILMGREDIYVFFAPEEGEVGPTRPPLPLLRQCREDGGGGGGQ